MSANAPGPPLLAGGGRVLRTVGLGLLHVLALPTWLVTTILENRRREAWRRAVRDGYLTCLVCGEREKNALDRAWRCDTCGYRELRSILQTCSQCGADPPDFVDCAACDLSIPVPRP